MSRSTEVYESAMFKRVANGFIFRAPGLWPFTRGRYLVATDVQKAKIAEHVTGPGRWRLLLAFGIWLAVYVGGVAGLALLTGDDDSTSKDIIIMVVWAAVTLLYCLQAWYVVTLRPLISGLPETAERITYRERRDALRKSLLMRSWLVAAAVCCASCVINLHFFLLKAYTAGHFTFGFDGALRQALWTTVLALLAVRFLYLEFRSAAASPDEDIEATSHTMIGRLGRRLERVEFENRQLRRALVAIVGLCTAFGIGTVLLSDVTPRILRADQIVIRNAKDQAAVILTAGANDTPTLSFYDAGRKLRMVLGLSASGSPSFGLFDANNKLREVSGLATNGSPTLAFYGADATRTFTVDGEHQELVARILSHFQFPAPPRSAVEDYLSAPGAKAWAVSATAHTRTITTGAPTAVDARRRALEECAKQAGANDCVVVVADNTWVGPAKSMMTNSSND